MNDADLESLAIKPGKLEPKFDRNVTSYAVILPSTVTKFNLNPLTSDSGASWTLVGHGFTRTLAITPGEQKTVTIEVSAEDGSTKRYTINITSLSPSDVTLSGIKLSIGSLDPEFQSHVYKYSVTVPWFANEVTILPESKEANVGGANKELTINLQYGMTHAEFTCTSPDKSASKTYSVNIVQDRIFRVIDTVLVASGNAAKNDASGKNGIIYCPLCLGVLHCPVSLKSLNSEKTTVKTLYCRQCIESVIRTRKIEPFDNLPLDTDCVQDVGIDQVKQLSSTEVQCCYSQNGCNAEITLKDLGAHMKSCPYRPSFIDKFEGVVAGVQLEGETKLETEACKKCSHVVRTDEMQTHLKQYCSAQLSNTKFSHSVEVKNWERKLQEMALADADKNNIFQLDGKVKLSFDQLQVAASRYAAMIKVKPKDHTNHFKLAVAFEEMYYARDVWGDKPSAGSGVDEDEEEDRTFDNLMDMASDSSKEDDITALCEARGVGKGAALAVKLKAIDEEYHSLIEQQQSAKADYVQKLYVWKSKQSVDAKRRLADSPAVNEDSFLGKAFSKYKDACALSPNSSTLHMHVGRHLLMQGRHDDALQRLQAAFGLKPTSIEARFYLGLACAKQFEQNPQLLQQQFAQTRLDEAVNYLREGVDFVLTKLFEEPDAAELQCCCAEVFVRNSNVLLLEGMLQLANLLKANGSKCETDSIGIVGAYKQASIACFHFLASMKHRNEVYRQMLWVLLRSHFELALFMAENSKKQCNTTASQTQDLQSFLERATALSNAFEFRMDSTIMLLQRKLCEEAVCLCPSSSKALFRLGDVLLTIHDQDEEDSGEILKDAEYSYRASIESEGKPAHSTEISPLTTKSNWWKQRHEKEAASNQQKQTVKQAKTGPEKNSTTNRAAVKGTATLKGGARTVPDKATVPTAAQKNSNAASKATVGTSRGGTSTAKSTGTVAPATRNKAVATGSKAVGSGSKVVATGGKAVATGGKAVATGKGAAVSSEKNAATLSAKSTPRSTAKNVSKPSTAVKAQQSQARKSQDSLSAKKSDPKLSAHTGSHHPNCVTSSKTSQKTSDQPGLGRPLPPSEAVKKTAAPEITETAIVQSSAEPVVLNSVSYEARLGLARILSRNNADREAANQLYRKVMQLNAHAHDAYIELGNMLAETDPEQAVEVYSKYPFGAELSFDDAYLHGEIVRVLMRAGKYDDPQLERSMIAYGTVMGLSVIEKHMNELENKAKFKILCNVFAGVNKRDVDDEEMQQFFKFKYWV
eukprot:gene20467-22483_t